MRNPLACSLFLQQPYCDNMGLSIRRACFIFFKFSGSPVDLADQVLLAGKTCSTKINMRYRVFETKRSHKHRKCPNTYYHRKEVEEKTRTHLFLAIVVFSLTFSSHFFSSVNIFNPIVHFFSYCFWSFASLRKQAEKKAEKWTIGLNMWKLQKKENRTWLRIQLFKWTVPLRVLFSCFSPSANFLWLFGDLYKFSTPFPLSVQVPCVSDWLSQTMFFLASKNLVCQNQLEKQENCIERGQMRTKFYKILETITKRWLKRKTKKSHRDGPFLGIAVFSVT